MERRKLFSQIPPETPRRKLFCGTCCEEEHEAVCQDCGYKMLTKEDTTALVCPKCGGKRFNFTAVDNACEEEIPAEEIKNEEPAAKEFSRRSLFEDEFQKEFSDTSDEEELKLKEFSGKTLSSKEYNEIFGNSELCERGFAEVLEDRNIKINDTAFIQSRLFSHIVITITKTMDLDPEIMNHQHSPEEVISGLSMPPKCIMLLKKAHQLPIEHDTDNWANDSGILRDLPIEYGGQRKPMGKFREELDDMYPDAPEDIIEILKKHGIINVTPDDSEVEIIK